MKFDELKAAALRLTPPLQQELRQALTVSLNASGHITKQSIPLVVIDAKAEAKADAIAEIFLDCIVQHMEGRGADFTSRTMLMRGSQFPAYRHKFRDGARLARYFMMAVEKSKIKRLAFMHLAVRCMYDNLTDMNVPISSRAMMNHVHRIPSIINQAFPGYAESGLLQLVIRQAGEDRART